MSTKPSEQMMDLLKELSLLKELDEKHETGSASGLIVPNSNPGKSVAGKYASRSRLLVVRSANQRSDRRKHDQSGQGRSLVILGPGRAN